MLKFVVWFKLLLIYGKFAGNKLYKPLDAAEYKSQITQHRLPMTKLSFFT